MSRASRRIIGSGVLVLVVGAVAVALFAGPRLGESRRDRPLPVYAAPDLLPEIQRLEASAEDKAKLAKLYFRQARVTGDVGWYDKAEAAAKASLKARPSGNFAAKLVLAEVWEKRHLFDKSLAMAKEVLKEAPRDPEGLYAYAGVSLAVGEVDEALRAADQAATLRPDTLTLTLRAMTLIARGRDAEAELSFRRALAVEQAGSAAEAAETRVAYANFLTSKGRYEEARDLVDETLRIVPGLYKALALSGDLYLKAKQPEKAAREYSEAFASSPQVSTLRKFSKVKRLLGDERGAGDAMREAEALARKEIASGIHAHPIELNYVLVAKNDPEALKEALQLATDEFKVRWGVIPWNALAVTQEKAGLLEAAAESMDAVLRTGVRNPDYYVTAARIAKGLGDSEKARLYYELALAENPRLEEAKTGLEALGDEPKRLAQKE